ncbi:elongation factor G [Minwuia thermotolerans]|uniref:Elongation factor G n=1 Tax=Minwuia thermotolerans TaxID=2056226 RepID=A0A2M9FYM6_9PROT|nr:elongation factor G [Minwuia thermotolerans]PJK28565.1 elongation factor G [Minwuia thermotolerans]
MSGGRAEGPRNIAIVGPYLSGKTSLLESILFATGAVDRKGGVNQGNTVGDGSAEAREKQMSVEVNAATTVYLGDEFTFLDCPGSIEFIQEAANALVGVDAAVLVCEADPAKATALQPWLKLLDELDLPRFIFVNKVDRASGDVQTVTEALQAVSQKPLILRQLPIVKDEIITGYVDLVQGRTYVYRESGPSELIEAEGDVADALGEARFAMLEQLADFDDHLMEELLEDIEPEKAEIFRDLTDNMQAGNIVSVLIGAAERESGVRRLLKALRHEVPGHGTAAARAGVDPASKETVAQVLKTYHTQHGGKLSLVRLWSGSIAEGDVLNGDRVGSLGQLMGQQFNKLDRATAGQVATLGRMEGIVTGDVLTGGGEAPELRRAPRFAPVFALALNVENRNDEVKLSGALAKLMEEDPSLSVEQNESTRQMLLWGQGDQHLKVAVARLKSKYGVSVETEKPKVPYKEAIRKGVTQHARHKKQSGGHGQFGDVTVEIKPLPRGSGFQFGDSITGGVVPKQYIPAVEAGVREYLSHGPLGFEVVDLAVTLTDGKYHAVDSSEQAFKTAGRMAMAEGLPQCDPVLLEPILQVQVMVPNEHTASVNNLISGRRGQILGFDAREGWPGWDRVSAYLPQAEVGDLIVELRSLTQGVGTFTFEFDRLQEVTGRAAEQAMANAAA